MCSSRVRVHEDGASGRAQLSRWLTGFLGLPLSCEGRRDPATKQKMLAGWPFAYRRRSPAARVCKGLMQRSAAPERRPLGSSRKGASGVHGVAGHLRRVEGCSLGRGFLGSGAPCRALRPEAPEPRGAGGNTVALGIADPVQPPLRATAPMRRCVPGVGGGDPVFVQLGLGVAVQQHLRVSGHQGTGHQCPEGHVLTDDAETARTPQLRGLTVSAGHCGRRCFSECRHLSVT